jgi:hypothetical protein
MHVEESFPSGWTMKLYFVVYFVLQDCANCFQTLQGDLRKCFRMGS